MRDVARGAPPPPSDALSPVRTAWARLIAAKGERPAISPLPLAERQAQRGRAPGWGEGRT